MCCPKIINYYRNVYMDFYMFFYIISFHETKMPKGNVLYTGVFHCSIFFYFSFDLCVVSENTIEDNGIYLVQMCKS